ncbi:MAG TPA: TolC family protein [Bryobacteraceae bacterium]|nr:TolC family protein [Bryobacteraceae bacterium]
MPRITRSFGLCLASLVIASCLNEPALAQQTYTWQQLRDKFVTANPTIRAGQDTIDESRATELTAFLRPNPEFTATIDQLDPFSTNPYRPLTWALPLFSGSYLHERQHKRELRLDSAKKGTAIAASQQDDLVRTMLFTLRNAFVTALQAKAVLDVAKENLAYYDRVLVVSQDRLKAGDIAQVDMSRLDLQRIQYQTDVQTATVNVRTAKIQLLALLNDRTPVEQFEISGPFDFVDSTLTLDEFRRAALDARPDLRAAVQAVEKAKTDHQLAIANGSTDPTFSVDAGRNPPIPAYFGVSVSIPLRIFDRNQGEKARTEIDIRRTRRLQEAATAQVYSDVDSAYATLDGSLALLRPYKAKYLEEARQVRDTITFAYQHGGASLLDFLNAENEYRSIRLNYLNLVGSYLTAANQLNLAVGREVISQ